jgi:hypothetical protein
MDYFCAGRCRWTGPQSGEWIGVRCRLGEAASVPMFVDLWGSRDGDTVRNKGGLHLGGMKTGVGWWGKGGEGEPRRLC